ncbi:excinuclease ABC subunit UvrA, partial [candidate division KSB1 bacterium]|nr:excinuclease ABC subunit UvrA [candidate division KSB1 bacterium]
YIDGLSPAIAIEQRTAGRNPRSTVATVTEIYDYLRLLFSRVGTPFCYNCNRKIQRQTVQQMVDAVLEYPEGTKIQILSPLVRGRKGEYRELFKRIIKDGYIRVRINGEIMEAGTDIKLDKNKKHVIEVVVDRLIIKKEQDKRLADSLETALRLGEGIVQILLPGNKEVLFSEQYACVHCNISYEELAPRMFSFNSPYGACPGCSGLGTRMEIDPELVIGDPDKSIMEGAVSAWGDIQGSKWYKIMLKSVAKHFKFSLYVPYRKLSQEVRDVVLYGSGSLEFTYRYDHRNGKGHGEWVSKFEGVIPNLNRRYKQTKSNYIRSFIEGFMNTIPCPDCKGARLKKEPLAVKIHDKNIHDVTGMSIKDAFGFFSTLKFSKREMDIAHQILKEVSERLEFLNNVGLDYLTLNRSAGTLSGGEAQRIRLATQIGSQLVGVLYILDEPSIGLHQRDNKRLIKTLTKLRDLGNTVIVVEHDRETILDADYLVDLGPGAGVNGGYIVSTGSPRQIAANKSSITGQYLSRNKDIPVPEKRRKPNNKFLKIYGARGNNLKKINCAFPLGTFICVTGVSGSGKSTLVNETLHRLLTKKFHYGKNQPLPYEKVEGLEYIDKVIEINQSPIGRTPRSNPATYTGLFTHIRTLFSQLQESKMRGYLPGRFSFNVKGGRCEACRGDGIIKIEMHFLPDVYVPCEVCKSKRYNRETLEIHYKGKNISEVLDMTVDEALEFLHNIPTLRRKLETIQAVGLGYIHLGQQATTLSGGEAQRVKLSTELSKIGTGKTFYILDEPTTGLHFEDIKQLLTVLDRLVDKGNTVVVIEHNLDVIKTADYIIDLGPEGGDEGGNVVATGTPEEVAAHKTSYTGKFLKQELKEHKAKIKPTRRETHRLSYAESPGQEIHAK